MIDIGGYKLKEKSIFGYKETIVNDIEQHCYYLEIITIQGGTFRIPLYHYSIHNINEAHDEMNKLFKDYTNKLDDILK